MYTHKQYMNHECSHNDFYEQFVTEGILNSVKRDIGLQAILESQYKHFNDIPLKRWDTVLCFEQIPKEFYKDNTNVKTLCNLICIAKAAARIIKRKGE